MRPARLLTPQLERERSRRRATLRAVGSIGALNLGQAWAYGQRIYPNGDRFVSAGGGYQLWLPADGNLAIDDTANGFGNPGHQQWRAGVQISNPAYAVLTTAGELQVVDTSGRVAWSSGVQADPTQLAAGGLLLQTDGNLVLYDAGGVSGGRVVWASQPGLTHSVLPSWLTQAAGILQVAGTVAGVPLTNFNLAIATGQNPVSALKADVSILANDKAIAEAVTSADYAKAWSLATNNGAVFDASLPSPAGKSYANGLVVPPSAAASPPVVALHVGSSATTTTTGTKVAAVAGAGLAAALAWWMGTHGWRWVTPRFARGLLK